jgi:hypothetical protein
VVAEAAFEVLAALDVAARHALDDSITVEPLSIATWLLGPA